MAIDGKNIRTKDDANIAFDRGNFERAQDERTQTREPQSPQPTLTPDGPLRNTVDRKVRDDQDAIRAKFAQDRAQERSR